MVELASIDSLAERFYAEVAGAGPERPAMHEPRIIMPGVGVGGLELGMTRRELWARTDSTVLAFLPPGAPDRVDHFLMLGVQIEYGEGAACRLMVFARMPDHELAPIFVLDEDVSAFTRADVEALLELHAMARRDLVEQIMVESMGLTFGFRDDAGQPSLLEFVMVEAIRASAAVAPFPPTGPGAS